MNALLTALFDLSVISQIRGIALFVWRGIDRYVFWVQWLVKILLLYPIYPAFLWKVINKIFGNYEPNFLFIFFKVPLPDFWGGVSLTAWYSLMVWWSLWTVGTYFALPPTGLRSTEVRPWVFTAFWVSLGWLIITAFIPINK